MHSSLLPFDSFHKRFFLIVTGLFLILSVIGLHGYSLSAWHNYLGQTENKEELILGTAKDIRSDDWAAFLPFSFAQVTHDPPFPVLNTHVGLQQNMLTIYSAPVLHPVALFRPLTWGWFVSPHVGLAVSWWGKVFGLFIASYLLFFFISNGHRLMSFSAAVLLSSAPFYQHWSYTYAEITFYGILSGLCFWSVLTSQTPRNIMIAAFFSGYFAACAGQILYPAYLVSMVWSILFILLFFIFQKDYHLADFRLHQGYRFLGIILTVSLALGSVFFFIYALGEHLDLILNTAYPGRRYELGGNMTLTRVFHNIVNIFPSPNLNTRFGNICEASSFPFLFPLIAGLVLSDILVNKSFRSNRALLILLTGCFFLLAWMTLGFPREIAGLTGFKMVPENRAVIGLGLLDVALLVAFLTQMPPLKEQRLLPLILWGVGIVYVGYSLNHHLHLRLSDKILWGSVATILFVSFLISRRRKEALLFLALFVCSTTIQFNPLVYRADFLFDNSISKELIKVDQDHKKLTGRKAKWVVIDAPILSTFPKILGLSTINGVHFHPQPELWQSLVGDKYAAAWNRFAHVHMLSSSSGIKMRNPFPDVLEVKMDLRKLLPEEDLFVLAPATKKLPKSLFEPKGGDVNYRIYARKSSNTPNM